MKKFLTLSLLILSLCGIAQATSYTCTTEAEIATAFSACATGDDIHIVGSISLTSKKSLVNKGVRIWGDTVISNVGRNAASGGGSTPSSTGGTVLTDNIMSANPMFQLEFYGTTGRLTVEGIEFVNGTHSPKSPWGMLEIYSTGSATTTSSNAQVRVTNCKIYQPNGRPATFFSWSGVMDHCWVVMNGESGFAFPGANIKADSFMSWSRPISEIINNVNGAFYIEDCSVFQTSAPRAVTDSFYGGRYGIRECYISNCSIETHGTESGGVKRGPRWFESYNNTIVATGAPSNPSEYTHFIRGGSGVIYNNTITGTWPGLLRMSNYRSHDDFKPYGLADGQNVWDNNDATDYLTGTHNGSAGASVLTDTTKTWTVNQWVGYSIQNVTQSAGADRYGGLIASNTATTITVTDGTTHTNIPTWGIGNTYKIRKINQALDQPGTGQSDLLSGGSDTVAPTPTTWPNQVTEPIYYWSNTGATTVSDDGKYHIISGTHYISGVRPAYTAFTYPHPYVGAADTTAPTVTSFTVNATGLTATINFSESVIRNSTTPTITLSGGAALLTYSSGSGTSSHVYAIDRIVYPGETGTGAATLPANAWEDAAGNDVATFSSYTITNNSTYSTGVPVLPSRRRAGTGAGAAISR